MVIRATSSRYIPKLTPEEIEENHRHFSQRVSLYQRRGLDFFRSREFILEKAQGLRGNILEIGSGSGYTTLSLAKAGYKFISIDNDKESLRAAALNLAYENLLDKVEFYLMDGRSLDFPSSKFQDVVIVNLFHHINNANRLLSETDRVLAAGGKLILADFNKAGMQIIASVHKDEGRTHPNCNVGRDYVYSYLHNSGYAIKDYQDKYHWVLIAEKTVGEEENHG